MEFFGILGGTAGYVVAFVVALSIIVAVHEYGHYIVGRWCGIHAEVFSLGFGKVLYSRTDRRGTEWQIAALPFGGYVKFMGDANAASAGVDGEAVAGLSPEELRRTMPGAPVWARAATVVAGPVFNFILSFVIFSAIVAVRGIATEPVQVGALQPLPQEVRVLEAGDTILEIDGKAVTDINSLYDATADLDLTRPVAYRIERDGAEMIVQGTTPFPPLISSVSPNSAAIDAGLEVGDVITSIDGEPITAFKELQAAVLAGEGAPVALKVWREGETLDFTMTPRRTDLPTADGGFETRYLIGINGGLAFEPATDRLGPLEAVQYGVQQTWFIVTSSINGLGKMISGAISSCNLSGPLKIATTAGQMASQGGQSFIWFVAVLSTAVGLLNLFPIPVLDGGHLVFHAWEAVSGKPPPERLLNILMMIGLTLILSLMVFALGNDLFCEGGIFWKIRAWFV
ncbi:MAG: RIP metalloprotease RseP [Vannielia sp.]|uniref:RIP metalloprotease RseP n=1 Tax=Rhodobacterales TaxID=204455 RepID=UPI00209584D7|nr:RIP metalloprotease RseP [Oceanicola sp. 502str15]MCO6382017.1 RIP metalloprotease RseP [Oceanicola sp. 502str15]